MWSTYKQAVPQDTIQPLFPLLQFPNSSILNHQAFIKLLLCVQPSQLPVQRESQVPSWSTLHSDADTGMGIKKGKNGV